MLLAPGCALLQSCAAWPRGCPGSSCGRWWPRHSQLRPRVGRRPRPWQPAAGRCCDAACSAGAVARPCARASCACCSRGLEEKSSHSGHVERPQDVRFRSSRNKPSADAASRNASLALLLSAPRSSDTSGIWPLLAPIVPGAPVLAIDDDVRVRAFDRPPMDPYCVVVLSYSGYIPKMDPR